MKNWIIAVAAAVVFSGCSSLQVQVGYNPEFDFKSHTNFAVVYVKKEDNRDLQRSRVSNILKSYIEKKGYKGVEKSKADFYFAVHLDVQKKSEVQTNYESMSLRPRYYDGYWNNPIIDANLSRYPYDRDMRVTTSTYEYEEGKLVIEVFDASKQEVVWQGIAKDEISPEYTQKQMTNYINEVIEKLFKDFPSK